LCFCVTLVSFLCLIPFRELAKGKHIGSFACKDNSDFIQQKDGGLCIFNAVTMHFLFLATCVWWFLQSFDLYLTIVFDTGLTRNRSGKTVSVVMHLFSWGLPLVFVGIAAGVGIYGNQDAGNYWCLTSIHVHDLDWLVLFAPVIFFLVFGLYNLMAIVWALNRSTQRSNTTDTYKGWWWQRYIRTFVFIIIFSFLLVSSVTYRSIVQIEYSTWYTAGADWVRCLLVDRYVNPNVVCHPGHPDPRISKNIWYLIQFVIAGQGICVFLAYGTNREHIYLWRMLLTRCQVKENHRSDTLQPNSKLSRSMQTKGSGVSKKSLKKDTTELTQSQLELPAAEQ